MKLYRMNEVDLLMEENWKDASVNAFVVPSERKAGEAESTLIISRDHHSLAKDIGEYADNLLSRAAQTLNRYRFLGRCEMRLGAQPAIQVDYAWAGPEQVEIRQRQIFLRYEDFFLIFTMSARSTDFSSYVESWDNTLDSVRLRKY